MSDFIIKIFMIVYFFLYYGILFVLNTYFVSKRIGKNPYVINQKKGIISYVETVIKFCGIIIPIVLLIFIVSKTLYNILVPINSLEGFWFDLAGITMMNLGFLICYTAQHFMRNSWRIGIDVESDVTLVTSGIFKYSRNPFFLGTMITYLGFFLILPNVISFTVGVLYYFLIQIQVRFEEKNLITVLEGIYREYMNRVKRWI